MNKKRGFTAIELVVVIILAGVATIFFAFQKATTDALERDSYSKTAINAMFYNLEEVFYAEQGFYPETIGEDNLKAMDPEFFTDPYGINIGDTTSSFTYEPTSCEDGKCAKYTLRAKLEKENEYVKSSRH
ncbi:MAG: type II secretion system GspH family protein [Candidatus Nomurabacteria bacterium]|jgi:prepilin-type N-terminal cleavage/methylation domain-containing protein|nr:type II secretion system GspH family protein [Candidatus Nomurabacteria bacterium]